MGLSQRDSCGLASYQLGQASQTTLRRRGLSTLATVGEGKKCRLSIAQQKGRQLVPCANVGRKGQPTTSK